MSSERFRGVSPSSASCALRQMRHSVPTDTFQTLVVSLVLTRLVYETVSWLAFRSTWSDDSSQC